MARGNSFRVGNVTFVLKKGARIGRFVYNKSKKIVRLRTS